MHHTCPQSLAKLCYEPSSIRVHSFTCSPARSLARTQLVHYGQAGRLSIHSHRTFTIKGVSGLPRGGVEGPP